MLSLYTENRWSNPRLRCNKIMASLIWEAVAEFILIFDRYIAGRVNGLLRMQITSCHYSDWPLPVSLICSPSASSLVIILQPPWLLLCLSNIINLCPPQSPCTCYLESSVVPLCHLVLCPKISSKYYQSNSVNLIPQHYEVFYSFHSPISIRNYFVWLIGYL